MSGGMRAAIGEAAAHGSRPPRLLFGAEPVSPVARLEERLDEILAALQRVLETLDREPGDAAAAPAPAAEARAVWLFLPTPAGYRMVEAEAAPTARGETLSHEGADYRVASVRRSPLLDGRPCLYLEAQPPAARLEVVADG
jgi:hypothetical protein